MHFFQLLKIVFLCQIYLAGSVLCIAEAADFIPKGSCCPSSRQEQPSFPEPKSACCEQAQTRFAFVEIRSEVVEEYAQASIHQDLNSTLLLFSSIDLFLKNVSAILDYPDKLAPDSFLKHYLSPRAPC